MIGIVGRVFFPRKDFDYRAIEGVTEPGWRMMAPLLVFAALLLCFGLYSGPVMKVLEAAAFGKM